MENEEFHKKVFTEFVINHDDMKHLNYMPTRRTDQKVIGILVSQTEEEKKERLPYYYEFTESLKEDRDNKVIDPNYDQIYMSFLGIDHNRDSVEFIKQYIEETLTTKESRTEFVESILKETVSRNIDAKNVYIVIHDHWSRDWFDEIIEV